MNAQSKNGSFDDEKLPDDASWQMIRSVINEMPVLSANLRDGVVAEIQTLNQPSALSTPAENRRTVDYTHRLAATVASLTAMLVLSISLSGLLDEPSRQVRVAGSELMASILSTSEDDWQVVVVKVPEASQARIRNSISTSALKTGMDVHSVDGADQDVSSNQPDLFISSADSAATVLNLVDKATGGVSAAEVVDMDRERLLSCFVESMQKPSASEKYFGQMLIVKRDDLKLEAVELLGSTANTPDSVTVDFAGKKRPILVLLTSQEVKTLGPQGAVETREHPVALLL